MVALAGGTAPHRRRVVVRKARAHRAELGGKSPAIIADDIPLAVLPTLVPGAAFSGSVRHACSCRSDATTRWLMRWGRPIVL
jgi:hypothetical protein